MFNENLNLQICWFCGLKPQAGQFKVGWPLREMMVNGTCFPEPEFITNVYRNEGAVICQSCLSEFDKVMLTTEYVTRHELWLDNWRSEVCDVEMRMITVKEMTFHIGCWFGLYPMLHDTSGTYSHSTEELILRGWRFSAPLGEVELSVIRANSPTSMPPSSDISPEVQEYLGAIISVADGSTRVEVISHIAKMRAFICDVTAVVVFAT